MNKPLSYFFQMRLGILVLLVQLVLSGCTSMQFKDFFQTYSDQMQPSRQAISQGDFNKATQATGQQTPSDTNYVLNLLEQGRIAYLAGNWADSKKWFNLAFQHYEEEQAKAKIQISKGIEKVTAVVSNDTAIRYELPVYELTMLHTYQALNYLHLGDIQGAMVEIRRANAAQDKALLTYEDDILSAQQELSDDASGAWSKANESFASMSERIGDVKNSIQNAYTFYLSALLYEATGEFNDAYIDYKKALEIYPDNIYLQQDVLRLAHQLAMKDDIVNFENKFGKFKASTLNSQEQGQIVVIYEQGLIDARQDVAMNLPIFTSSGNARFYSFSVPTYQGIITPNTPISLQLGGEEFTSKAIVSFQALVAKQLQEAMPGIIARQVVRVIAKEQIRQQMSKQGGDIGNILATIYNVASENADTRTWLTLPQSVQVLKHSLPSGKHDITVKDVPGLAIITAEIKAGRTTLILVNKMNGYTDYNTINL